MIWLRVYSTDSRGRKLADRHYSRQKPGTRRWIKPCRCIAMIVPSQQRASAVWASCWPFAEYVKHAWPGAWECSLFRNESACLASDLITQAVQATRHVWGEPPPLGMVTFIDPRKVRPTMVRGRETWGYCYLKAGWEQLRETTKDGKLVFRLRPDRMPESAPIHREQRSLFDLFDPNGSPDPCPPQSSTNGPPTS